jgi:hypothetical protein
LLESRLTAFEILRLPNLVTLLAACAVAGSVGSADAQPEVVAMNTQTLVAEVPVSEDVVRVVIRRSDWQREHVSIDHDPQLEAPPCHFYRASNTHIPGAGLIRFALAEGELVGVSGDTEDMARVLRRCDASRRDAAWWAAFVAAFVPERAARAILPGDNLGIALVNSSGGRYAPPKLTAQGGSTRVEFFMVRRGVETVRVVASLPPSGALNLDAQPVAAAGK